MLSEDGMTMDKLQPDPDPGAGLQRLIDERALTILADFRPGASNGVTPGTFPGLLQSLEDRFPGLRVIGVCGDNGNAAGARIAEGLALSAAKTGRRTLVIDTDGRSPRQHILWNGPGSPIGPGLRDTLVAGLPVSPDAIHPTRLSNCRLIPMGYPGDIPDPELFAHVHLEKLLGVHAPAMADTVVVAMPSLDMVSMCAAVGIHMDAVLVALGHKAGTDMIGAYLDRLLESGTRVAGVVVVPAGEESASTSAAVPEAVVPVFPPPNPFAQTVPQGHRPASALPVASPVETHSENEAVLAGVDNPAESRSAEGTGSTAGNAVPAVLESGAVVETVAPVASDSAVGAEFLPSGDSVSAEPTVVESSDRAQTGVAVTGPETVGNETGATNPSEETAVSMNGEAEGSVGIDDLSSLLNGWRRRSFAPVVPEPVRPGADGPVAEPAWNLLPLEREEWTRGTLGEEAGQAAGSTVVPPPTPAPAPLDAVAPVPLPPELSAGATAGSSGAAAAEPEGTESAVSAPEGTPVALEAVPTPPSPALVSSAPQSSGLPEAPPVPVAEPVAETTFPEPVASPSQSAIGNPVPESVPSGPSFAAGGVGAEIAATEAPLVAAPVAAERVSNIHEEAAMDNFASLGGGTGGSVATTSGATGNPAVFEIVPSPGGRLTLAASTILSNGRESIPARVELSVDSLSLRSMRGTSPESAHGAMVLDIQVADTRSGCGLRLLHGDDLTSVLEVVFEPGAGFRFASGPGGSGAPRISFETTEDGGTLFRAQSQWIDAELLRRQGPGSDPSHWTFRLQLAPGR